MLQLLIDGMKIDASNGATFTRKNPITGEDATVCAAATVDDARAAADAAARAFPGWSNTGPGERRALLLNAADNLHASSDAIVQAMAEEIGATVQRQPPWPVATTILSGGSEWRTG